MLKMRFYMLAKVCWCASKACAPGRVPSLATPLIRKERMVAAPSYVKTAVFFQINKQKLIL